MRFGLDRMRRMMTALGGPQRRFDTVHVLGTNGKTSTTRMIAAILERHGVRTGSYTSPHLVSYAERLRVGEREVAPDTFAQAIGRAVSAAERVDRTLAGDDHVTQFELLTAAALSELAEQRVEVAVVEAGLGGRYDATSVTDARVTVLTNVALEHTRWLGPSIRDIAGEKLAALHPRRNARARPRTRRGCGRSSRNRGRRARRTDRLVRARAPARGAERRRPARPRRVAREGRLSAAQLRARASRRADLAARGGTRPRRARGAPMSRAQLEVPGRMQLIDDDPPTLLDSAHNPHAVAALVESLPAVLGARRPALVMGVLDDKDAAGMLKILLAKCERAWFTAPPSPRALSPAALQSLARQLDFHAVSCEPRPTRALAEARRWAAEDGADGARAVLATGSVYLVGDLLSGLSRGDGRGG